MNQLLQPNNRIEWARAYLEASSMNETFEDVHIVTAKSELVETACDLILAQADMFRVYDDADHQAVMVSARKLVDEGAVSVREYVKVDNSGIRVCINTETTEDPDAMWRALDMVADALQVLDGSHGTINFSNKLKFQSSEIPWFITQ